MSKVSLPEIVARVDRLPEMPQVAMRVSRMLEDPDTNAEKLAEVIKLDPSFTSQVLRLCNSAAYGFSRKIATVKEAVAILGFKSLKSMVYTIIAKIALDRPIPGYSLREGDLWYNSLACAVYAKHIATREKFPDPELAFTAGMLRDIGKIVMGEFVGTHYAEIERTAVEKQIDFLEAEEEVLGFNHSIVGTRVAEKWNLPQQLVQVIRHHHKPLKLPPTVSPQETKLITIVHLADAFTMMLSKTGNDGMMYSIDYTALEKAGMQYKDAESLERLMSELVDQNQIIKSLADSFTTQEA